MTPNVQLFNQMTVIMELPTFVQDMPGEPLGICIFLTKISANQIETFQLRGSNS